MIKNTIDLAKKQLEEHSRLGCNSNLSIFDVANLMDTIHNLNQMPNINQPSIFFGYSAN